MGVTRYILKYKTGRIRQAMTGAIEHALLRGEKRQAKGKLSRRSGLGYQKIAAEVKELVAFDCAAITIIDGSKGTLSLAYLSQQTGGQLSRGETVPLEDTLSGYVANTRSTIICGDITAHTYFQTIEHPLGEGLRSVISVPLVWGEKINGALILFSRIPNAYGLREQVILERLAKQIAPAVEGTRIFHEVSA